MDRLPPTQLLSRRTPTTRCHAHNAHTTSSNPFNVTHCLLTVYAQMTGLRKAPVGLYFESAAAVTLRCADGATPVCLQCGSTLIGYTPGTRRDNTVDPRVKVWKQLVPPRFQWNSWPLLRLSAGSAPSQNAYGDEPVLYDEGIGRCWRVHKLSFGSYLWSKALIRYGAGSEPKSLLAPLATSAPLF